VAAALAGRLSLTAGLLLNEGTALLIIANGLRLLCPAGRGPARPGQRHQPWVPRRLTGGAAAGGRGGCGCCRNDRGGSEPLGADMIAQDLDLIELERRLERDLQAAREQLGRGHATA